MFNTLAIAFSDLFTEFTDTVGTVWSFFTTNTVFLALAALPVGLLAVGAVMKLFR